MAERRMFAKSVTGSARFLRMPPTSRLLYYDLGMQADDDGIVEAFTVMRTTGATEDDLRVLVAKGFISILNEDLVSFIVDWKRNNLIKKDRYHPSFYQDLLVQIQGGTHVEPDRNQDGTQVEPEDRLGKSSLNKGGCESAPPPSLDTVCSFFSERGAGKASAEKFFLYFSARGWLDARNRHIVNWQARAAQWIAEDAERAGPVEERPRLELGEDGKCRLVK